MPPLGTVNNKTGVNGFTLPGGQETAYGAVKRLEQSVRAVPIGTTPGQQAPRRAKRNARAMNQAGPAPAGPAIPATSAPAPAQQAWQQVALIPGLSLQAREYIGQLSG